MTETKIVDVWLVQYASDRANGTVRPDGCIWPTEAEAREYADRLTQHPWCRCISVSGPFRQEVPITVAYDTSDKAILGFVLGGGATPAAKRH